MYQRHFLATRHVEVDLTNILLLILISVISYQLVVLKVILSNFRARTSNNDIIQKGGKLSY